MLGKRGAGQLDGQLLRTVEGCRKGEVFPSRPQAELPELSGDDEATILPVAGAYEERVKAGQ